ncbi:type I 3-dehydroquinate dehydratase [Haloferula sargassicola]
MNRSPLELHRRRPLVVGSIGSGEVLAGLDPADVASACDVVEIRLDLLSAKERQARGWRVFEKIPLLFTARRASEGGAGDLSAEQREAMLIDVIAEAAAIDIEVASIPEMAGLRIKLHDAGVPWIASFHDFRGVPDLALLHASRENARNSGAAAFKAAFELGWQLDSLPALAQFVAGSDFPTSLMGMGPFAPMSRVMFAQLGSVLNYGYLGDTPTAPGQWSARQLREAIASVSCSATYDPTPADQ